METMSNNGEKEGFVYSRFKAQAGGFIFKTLRRAQKTASPTIPFGDVTFLCRDGKVVTNSVYLGATCSLMRETFASLSPYEREKIVISVPDYGTEVLAQAITILYGGEVMFDNPDGQEQQLLMEALLELGFPYESLVDVPSGKEPNVSIKRFLEDQGTELITNQESTIVKEPPPEDSNDVGDQSQDHESMTRLDDEGAEDLVDQDEVISLNDVNSEEEAELWGITVEEARKNRRMREKKDVAGDESVDDEEKIPLDDMNSEEEAEVMGITLKESRLRRKGQYGVVEEMEIDGEAPKDSLRKNASRNRKRANEIQPEKNTMKKSKTNGSRRSSRLSESQKANLSEKSARSSTTSSNSKENAPITDENTAPASTRTSSRIRQSLSKKASAAEPLSVDESPSQTPSPKTRKKTQAPQLNVPPPQARKEVEVSPVNAVNTENDTNNNGSGFHINIEVDPKEIIKIKPLEVTVGDQASSSDTKAGKQGSKPTQDKRTAAKPKEASRSNKRDRSSEAEPDSTEEIIDQPAVNKNSISPSPEAAVSKNQLEATQQASEITDSVSTPALLPETSEADEVAPNEHQNIQKDSTDSESNTQGNTLAATVINLSEPGPVTNSKHPAIKDPTDLQSAAKKDTVEKQTAENKDCVEKPSIAKPIEHLPECDSVVTYPPGTETLDALTRWRRTIEYCNICEQQYKAHGRAAKCLTKHGRQRCWICLKVMLTSFYEQHCTEEHGNLPGMAKNIVKCPQCETCLEWSNLKPHAASAHLWKIPTKVETTELDAIADVEQPNATATNIRIKSPSALFEEDEAEDEPEVSSSSTGHALDAVPPRETTPSLSNSTQRDLLQPPESTSNRQRLPGTLASTEEAGRTMAPLSQHASTHVSASSSRFQEVNQTTCATTSMSNPLTQHSYWSPGVTPPPPYQSNASRPYQGPVQTATLSSSGLGSNLHQGHFNRNQRAVQDQTPSSSFVLRSGNTTPGVQQPVSSQSQTMIPGFRPVQATFAARQQMPMPNVQPRSQYVLSSAANLRLQTNARFGSQQMNTSTYLGPSAPVSNHPRLMTSNAAMPPPLAPLSTIPQAAPQIHSFTQMGPPPSLMGTSVGSRIPASRLTTPAPERYAGTEIRVNGITFTAVEDHSVDNATRGNFEGSSLDGEAPARNLEEQESLLEMEQFLDGSASRNDSVSGSVPGVADNTTIYAVEDEDDDVSLNFDYDEATSCYTCKKCDQIYEVRNNAREHICLAD